MSKNIQNTKEVLNKFIGKENNINKSIIVLRTYSVNSHNEEISALSEFATLNPVVKINLLNDNIMLDINFSNILDNDFKSLIYHMDIYNALCSQTVEAIFNTITIVRNDDSLDEQITFANPKFYEKCSNTAGRPVNGLRLLYEYDNVAYQIVTDDMLDYKVGDINENS